VELQKSLQRQLPVGNGDIGIHGKRSEGSEGGRDVERQRESASRDREAATQRSREAEKQRSREAEKQRGREAAMKEGAWERMRRKGANHQHVART
jgi:hypothetical protein